MGVIRRNVKYNSGFRKKKQQTKPKIKPTVDVELKPGKLQISYFLTKSKFASESGELFPKSLCDIQLHHPYYFHCWFVIRHHYKPVLRPALLFHPHLFELYSSLLVWWFGIIIIFFFYVSMGFGMELLS